MVKLAMYKAPGTLLNRLIRLRTNSPYSHCELLLSDGLCYSSSHRDGGVRRKYIEMVPEHWDLIDMPWADELQIKDYWERTKGSGYDWLGVFVGQLFYVNVGTPGLYFCSEWCAAAVGLPGPWRYNPGTLGDIAKRFVA